MKPHERKYLSDNLSSGFAIVHHVKRVRGCVVICECNRQIATQRFEHETVYRLVQLRIVLTRSHNEQRDISRKIIN